ncbi:MAG: ribose 5-phosphate isomerase B [Ignavibacteria bacterium]|nr:ribose 5-phosphate isomerase B [Ignavibacteria bacterium]
MAEPKRVAVAADHAGFYLKGKILSYLKNEKVEFRDFGTWTAEDVDYPDFAHPLANAVAKGEFDLGISICGTGNGINMTVNKHQGIRGALCWNEEMSRLARAHNDANICAIPGRYVSESEAILIVKTFLSTGFDEGRHRKRIDKIPIKHY